VREQSPAGEQVVPVVAVALLASESVEEHELAGAGVGAVDRDAEEVDPGPPEAHHGREQVAPPAVVLLLHEVPDEHEREGDLRERSAENHHRVAEELDPEGHEEHVPEFVDCQIDVAQEGDIGEIVAEGVEGKQDEDRCEGDAGEALYAKVHPELRSMDCRIVERVSATTCELPSRRKHPQQKQKPIDCLG
jgi:hypothetical protein